MKNRFITTTICLLPAILIICGIIYLADEKPLNVLKILFNASLGSWEALSGTLYYATPLLLTGAAVLIPYYAGLFHIGAEGQLYIGSMVSVTVGVLAERYLSADSSMVVRTLWILFAALSSAVAAGICGAFVALLKTKRQVHEVITTIMMNFIFYAITNWFILNVLKNPDTQSVETLWIAEPLRVPFLGTRLPYSFFWALCLSVFAIVMLHKSWWGYRVRASGMNSSAAHTAGIAVDKTLVSSMFFGSALAGLVGTHEIFFTTHRLIDGFSPGLGFTGIAIALMSRGRILWFLIAVMFFASLHKGTLDLDLETERITRDFALLIQSVLLIVLALYPSVKEKVRARMKK